MGICDGSAIGCAAVHGVPESALAVFSVMKKSSQGQGGCHGQDLNNLGLALKRCGELRKAHETYAAAQRCGYEQVARNNARLLSEMREWKGTAGEYADILDQ